MKKLIATDYDGTFRRGGIINPKDREAVKLWREKGNYFGFVTGRGMDFFETAKNDGIEVDFMLIYNGAMLARPDATVIKEYLIPRSTFEKLYSFFAALPDARLNSKPNEKEFYHQHYSSFDSPERALDVADEVNRLFGNEINAVVNGVHVNIGKKGSGKARGVTDALEYFSLPSDAAAVFGDDFNDIDMLIKHSGWAVSTARPEVLKLAPHICESVGEYILMNIKS